MSLITQNPNITTQEIVTNLLSKQSTGKLEPERKNGVG